jgi:hypothetical protein
MPARARGAERIVVPSALVRVRGRKARYAAEVPEEQPVQTVRRPAKAAQLLALAHNLREAIESGRLPDGASVARTLGFTRTRISRILDLTLLTPDIQEEVLALEAVDGAEPAVNERVLRAATWREQRERFAREPGKRRRRPK